SIASTRDALFVGARFALRVDRPGLIGGVNLFSLARYDGNDWTSLGSGVNGLPLALTISGGALYAAGTFTQAGGSAAFHIARWDGLSAAPRAPLSAEWRSAVPNPFSNGGTFLQLRISRASRIRVSIHDLTGRM